MNDEIVDVIVNEVKWWYDIGEIDSITIEDIYEVINILYPKKFSSDEIEDLVFRVKMAI